MIKITRGDSLILKFQRRNSAGVITEKAKELYFTVKNNANQKDFTFQKRLDHGITYNDNDYYYRITINPSDTESLSYGYYKYDIEVKDSTYTKTISLGEFLINKEITFKVNEVK